MARAKCSVSAFPRLAAAMGRSLAPQPLSSGSRWRIAAHAWDHACRKGRFPSTFATPEFRPRASLEPDRITAADRTAPQDSGIDADVDLVVLGRRTQDAWIPGQITLR